jgi:ATP-dependent protease ClpP protease subunit
MSKWFEVKNKAESEPVEILIYDQIGKDWWDGSGVQAKDFAAALKDIPKDREIVVAINSPGGNVWDGLAIYNQLKLRGEKVTTRVDGLAASIASIIALAGHDVQIPANGLFMIHDPSGMCMGTADEMEQMAAELDKHADVLAGIYSQKTGRTAAEMREMMRAETWMTGSEAVEGKFADTVTDEIAFSANASTEAWRERFAPKGRALPKQKKPDTNPVSQLKDKMPEEKTPSLEPKVDRNAEELKAVKAQLAAERTARISARLDNVIAKNPALDREEWLPVVLDNESVLDNLAKIEAPTVGVSPLKNPAIENLGNKLVEDYSAMKPGADRKSFAIQNHSELMERNGDLIAKRQRAPQAANTMASGLVTDYLQDALVVVASNKLAPMAAFSRSFGVDPIKPRATVQVPKATSGSTVQTNPSNFESGDGQVDAISVTVNQKSVSFHVTNTELQQGYALAQLAEKNAHQLADAISDVWTPLLDATTYSSAITIGTAANFDTADLPQIYAAAKNYNRKNLILDGGHLAYLLPQDKDYFRIGEAGAYGFDGIWEQNRWTTAQTNTVGFICSPDAIAIAAGIPLNTVTTSTRRMGVTTMENLGLSVATCEWDSDSTREQWASYDIMIGAADGDTTQANVLISA